MHLLLYSCFWICMTSLASLHVNRCIVSYHIVSCFDQKTIEYKKSLKLLCPSLSYPEVLSKCGLNHLNQHTKGRKHPSITCYTNYSIPVELLGGLHVVLYQLPLGYGRNCIPYEFAICFNKHLMADPKGEWVAIPVVVWWFFQSEFSVQHSASNTS